MVSGTSAANRVPSGPKSNTVPGTSTGELGAAAEATGLTLIHVVAVVSDPGGRASDAVVPSAVTGLDTVRSSRTRTSRLARGPRALSPAAIALWPVPRYRGQVVVLTNGGRASACEDLVLALKGHSRVVVVGDTTFGATGQPVFVDFGDGMTARVSARRMSYRIGDGEGDEPTASPLLHKAACAPVGPWGPGGGPGLTHVDARRLRVDVSRRI